MAARNKIKVLVVDDSIVFREVIARGISSDPLIEVVATAGDPFEARDKILQFHPHVITCDIEMPKMNGIEFVRRLLPQYFVPVVMVSAVSQAVFEAMEAGVVDFVVKPDVQSPAGVAAFIRDMIYKIKVASTAKTAMRAAEDTAVPTAKTAMRAAEDTAVRSSAGMLQRADDLIAIGASTGGTEAIFSILRRLPSAVPGIVIVQHIPPVFSRMFAERLNSQISLRVKEAETGDYIEPGTVLVAPGDRHMRLKKIGAKYRVECFEGERVNGHCPSVDVLFESVAKEAGRSAVGVLLTGMGRDGAKGLLAIRRRGGRTIAQDEASSVVYGMPKVAYEIGAVQRQTPLGKIPQALFECLG